MTNTYEDLLRKKLFEKGGQVTNTDQYLTNVGLESPINSPETNYNFIDNKNKTQAPVQPLAKESEPELTPTYGPANETQVSGVFPWAQKQKTPEEITSEFIKNRIYKQPTPMKSEPITQQPQREDRTGELVMRILSGLGDTIKGGGNSQTSIDTILAGKKKELKAAEYDSPESEVSRELQGAMSQVYPKYDWSTMSYNTIMQTAPFAKDVEENRMRADMYKQGNARTNQQANTTHLTRLKQLSGEMESAYMPQVQTNFDKLQNIIGANIDEYDPVTGKNIITGENPNMPDTAKSLAANIPGVGNLVKAANEDIAGYQSAVKDLIDAVARSRTGAAMNESELKHYKEMLENTNISPNIRMARLRDLKDRFENTKANIYSGFADVADEYNENMKKFAPVYKSQINTYENRDKQKETSQNAIDKKPLALKQIKPGDKK